jgi:hypothetical protein
MTARLRAPVPLPLAVLCSWRRRKFGRRLREPVLHLLEFLESFGSVLFRELKFAAGQIGEALQPAFAFGLAGQLSFSKVGSFAKRPS